MLELAAEQKAFPTPSTIVKQPPTIMSSKAPPSFKVVRLGLLKRGVPAGMASEIASKRFRPRIWLIDNNDRSEYPLDEADASLGTLWLELKETLKDHVHLAGLFGVPTTFGFLHGENACDVSVSEDGKMADESTITTAIKTIENSRTAETVDAPWAALLVEVHRRVQANPDSMEGVCLVLATPDKLPVDDREFLDSVQTILDASVSLVIRHVTRDPQVIKHNNKLKTLKKNVEIVGDFYADADKVAKQNPWLYYSRFLHQCRELGYKNKPMTKMVRRTLKQKEAIKLMSLLFGKLSMKDAPTDMKELPKFVSTLTETNRWTTENGTLEACVNSQQLDRLYGDEAAGTSTTSASKSSGVSSSLSKDDSWRKGPATAVSGSVPSTGLDPNRLRYKDQVQSVIVPIDVTESVPPTGLDPNRLSYKDQVQSVIIPIDVSESES